jgi:hypothetical protein
VIGKAPAALQNRSRTQPAPRGHKGIGVLEFHISGHRTDELHARAMGHRCVDIAPDSPLRLGERRENPVLHNAERGFRRDRWPVSLFVEGEYIANAQDVSTPPCDRV